MELLCITIAFIAVVVSNMLCFILGARVGQKVVNGEPIEMPKIDPTRAIAERQGRRAAEAEQERYNAILRNIEAYNGTDIGQEDVPRG
jgi:hypothetical protein